MSLNYLESGFYEQKTEDATRRDVRELLLAVLCKHGRDHINNNSEFGLVRGGDIDEDISRIERDFGVI